MERSCFTCAHSPPYPKPGSFALTGDEDADKPIIDYCEASGANTLLGNGYPADRTIECPSWASRRGVADRPTVAPRDVSVAPAAHDAVNPDGAEKLGGGGSSADSEST